MALLANWCLAFLIVFALSKCVACHTGNSSLTSTGNEHPKTANQTASESDGFTTNSSSSCKNHIWRFESDCECASPLDGIVYCDSSKAVFLYSQYCMSIDQNLGEEVVGRCPYTYSLFVDPNVSNIGLYLKLPNNVDQLETTLCSRLNREGFFCGSCKENYSYPIYPDFMECVECNPRYHARNWILYILISYGPLTVFLMLVLCLRISATSASMNAFIFVAQVMSHPPFQRGFNHTIETSYLSKNYGAVAFMRFLHSLYGLWNLDFFTALIPEFCLPNLKVHGIIALTYITAFYPLMLLILIYILVELHSRNFRFIVWLWKPFNMCYVRFRRQWDIRASVIDAFATFLLLSYVKFLFVSSDFLAPTKVMTKNGSTLGIASYFNANITLSADVKIILAIIGVSFILLLFVLLPAVLLLLYPCHFCQKCLTYSRLNSQAMHFLMDSFHGCYKNGTNGTRDCRSFASVFLLARIAISVEYAVTLFNYHAAVLVTCTCLAVMIAVVHPYNKKNNIYNHLDPLMILFLIIWLSIFRDTRQAAGKHLTFQHSALPLCYVSLIFPLVLVSIYWLQKIVKSICSNLKLKFCRVKPSDDLDDDLDDDLLEQRSLSPYMSSSKSMIS